MPRPARARLAAAPPLPVRPTAAQLLCGCSAVVLSTFVALWLSDVRSGAGVVAIAAAGLVLGVVVAVTAAAVAPARAAARRSPLPATGSHVVHSHTAVPMPRTRVARPATEPRVGEHSLPR
jgi:hypothetical protein